jgi:hypothetical protein
MNTIHIKTEPTPEFTPIHGDFFEDANERLLMLSFDPGRESYSLVDLATGLQGPSFATAALTVLGLTFVRRNAKITVE